METNIVSIINDLCKRNDMTVGQLERELKFSQGLISRWDKNSPSVDKIIAVADYFKTSVDYILGRTSTDSILSIEEMFINKIIEETESYLLQWNNYFEGDIPSNTLKDHFISAYNWKYNDTITTEEIKFMTKYYSSYLFVVGGYYNNKYCYFLIMQLDINNQKFDNFVPISSLNDFDKTNRLFDAITLCTRNYEQANKSRAIIQSYINSNSRPDIDYVTKKDVVYNFLTTLPGFVLDARAGTYLMNELNEIKKQVNIIQDQLHTKRASLRE
ncbi:helix-turn-helix transcriptional regulator [Clostridium sp. HBUAS56010]|uniref:helix-turn-helix domain-containing protein n=1 Tax=Clostridium sp. HBUAS56010 TaxID=2571127 RepID=UPI001178BE33|nr:helix-turn-helix transcriptional regulator [Clostridium sp. HBUAS56010]